MDQPVQSSADSPNLSSSVPEESKLPPQPPASQPVSPPLTPSLQSPSSPSAPPLPSQPSPSSIPSIPPPQSPVGPPPKTPPKEEPTLIKEKKPKKGINFLLIALLFTLALGGGGAFYAYQKITKKTFPQIYQQAPGGGGWTDYGDRDGDGTVEGHEGEGWQLDPSYRTPGNGTVTVGAYANVYCQDGNETPIPIDNATIEVKFIGFNQQPITKTYCTGPDCYGVEGTDGGKNKDHGSVRILKKELDQQNKACLDSVKVVGLPANLPSNLQNMQGPEAIYCQAGGCEQCPPGEYQKCCTYKDGGGIIIYAFRYRNCSLTPLSSPSPSPSSPPQSPPPGVSCTQLTPQNPTPSRGSSVTFTCSGKNAHHYNYRVIKDGVAGPAQESTSTFNYTVPTDGTNFIVQCQACNSQNICTNWGVSQQ